MRSTVEIVSQSDPFVYDLVSLDRLKGALLITDATEDTALQSSVTHWSKIIAEDVGRVFALQDVIETIRFNFREWTWYFPSYESSIRLARAPVLEITSLALDDVEIDADKYDFNSELGVIFLRVPYYVVRKVVIAYSAGYVLPDEAPEKLQQACIQAIGEGRLQAQNQGQDIRDIRHGDTGISYFSRVQPGEAGAIPPGVKELIASYRRLVL
jgi:hypothetical protein